jgi:thioredoxin-related protein
MINFIVLLFLTACQSENNKINPAQLIREGRDARFSNNKIGSLYKKKSL